MPVIEAVRGDITRIPADAIVNSANVSLLAGGGVCGAIHRAAGAELERACRTIGSCPTGGAVVTPAFALPARWVIHAVGPRWLDGKRGEAGLLRDCYRSIVAVVTEIGARTITVPSISTGIYRFPLDLAAQIAVSTMADAGGTLEHVAFVCFDEATYAAYDAGLRAAR
jgi:O-acetyl-ADP-ribose deacetylase (regulator of RNase III)